MFYMGNDDRKHRDENGIKVHHVQPSVKDAKQTSLLRTAFTAGNDVTGS